MSRVLIVYSRKEDIERDLDNRKFWPKNAVIRSTSRTVSHEGTDYYLRLVPTFSEAYFLAGYVFSRVIFSVHHDDSIPGPVLNYISALIRESK